MVPLSAPIPYKGCSRGPKLGTYSDWGLSSVLVINKHLSHHGAVVSADINTELNGEGGCVQEYISVRQRQLCT